MITSKTNSKIKNIRKLLESGKARNGQGVFVAEGEHLVLEIPSGSLQELYFSEARYRKLQQDPQAEQDFFSALPDGCLFEVVSDEVFRSISDTVHPQGMLAVVNQPVYQLEEILGVPEAFPESESGQIAVLEDIRDPGNMGTILRTAEAAGVKAVIMSRGCVDVFNPKVVRSTMGSIFRVPFVVMDLPEAIGKLRKKGFQVYGTSLSESRPYTEVAYGAKTAFVVGNEANGISKEVLALTTANVIIPMRGKVESLNAAVSLAVLLFHFRSVQGG